MPLNSSSFEARVEAVENRIQDAVARAGRRRDELTLVAVSKKFSAEAMRSSYAAGLREFGENYVQEFLEKKPKLHDLLHARFHLIGHLQSNKARQACELFDVVQTVDTPKLLSRLDAAAAERNARLELLLEIKLSDEEAKAGASPEMLPGLLEAAASCSHVEVTGLMTMPPWSDNPENSRPYFKQLAGLSRQYGLKKLSMGMSADFEVAIEEGATLIRVGTALFGARPKLQAVSTT